jgi:hypothetical protein
VKLCEFEISPMEILKKVIPLKSGISDSHTFCDAKAIKIKIPQKAG